MRGACVIAVGITLAGCRQILGIDELGSDDGAMIDAVVSDAPVDAFDTSQCPAMYQTAQTSAYRAILATAHVSQHHADCADDAPGLTHLVTLETTAEATAVATLIPGDGVFYVGAVQAPGEVDAASGWLAITGGEIPLEVWLPSQPDDFDGIENGVEQIGIADAAIATVRDWDAGNGTYPAVCECDGMPIDPVVASWVPAP
jgi:hypothetical protein